MRIARISIKAGIAGLLTTALASAALVAAPTSQAATADPLASPAAYTAWLSDQASAGVAGASTTLAGFNALPSDQQVKFLSYVKDPSITQKFVTFLNGVADPTIVSPIYNSVTGADGIDNSISPFPRTGEITAAANVAGNVVASQSTNNGDVQMSATSATTTAAGTQVTAQGGRAGDWHAWYKVNDKIFGIKITEVKIWVDYHSTTTRVTKVYNANASHYNYVPFSSFSHGPVSKWISAAGNAHAETVWTGKLSAGPEWSATEHIWANETGYLGGSLK